MVKSNKHISSLIKQGEGMTLEFKECRNALNRDVYETVCAFSNRHGGHILLGVDDSGKVTGIEPGAIEQIKKDFVTAINNPQKIDPPCYLAIDEVSYGKNKILHIFVPESSQVHRCKGRILDRNEDGDFDITSHTRLVASLYHRKQTVYCENRVFPFAPIDDLRHDLIDKCRKIASLRRKDHPWAKLENLDLLKSAQLYQTDPVSGKSGVTLAGILLLGNDNLLLSTVPYHRTDLILRKVNLDRYDDRDLVETNLIESYERIMAFIAKHLPDPFFLEGDTRISLRDAIFREIASNILIHREYTNAFPAKVIIERGQVRTENSNKPHGFGAINLLTFTPFPKNPVIARFFREIGRADELGSGARNLMKYGRIFGGADPEMVEGDIFTTTLKVPEFGSSPRSETRDSDQNKTGQVNGQVNGQVKSADSAMGEKWVLIALQACVEPQKSSAIQSLVGIKHRETFQRKYLDKLLAAGLLEQTIPDKPQSRLQKYRLTTIGKEYLKKQES